MEFINIVPVNSLHHIKGQKMHMLLTHLVERYQSYVDFAKNEKGYKILDNSLIELGSAVDIGRVVDAAHVVSANEIVLMDSYLNKNETLRLIEKCLTRNDLKHFKKMAVVQGSNANEWFECFDEINKIKEIDVIGIPKVCHTLHEKGRKAFVDIIETDKEIHLLGLWDNMTELLNIDCTKVRSVDTSLLSLNDIKGKSLFDSRDNGDVIDLEKDKIYGIFC